MNDDNYPSDEQTIANDLYTALIGILFTQQPAYQANPFYIFGESYGGTEPSFAIGALSTVFLTCRFHVGKYVPWLASTVIANNAKSSQKINLKAIGIGNGW